MYVYQPMNLNSDLATLYKTRSRYPGVKVFQKHIGTKAMYACTCICNIYAYECVCVCVCVNLNLIAWLEFVVVVLVAKSCLTLCESTDRSLPESSVRKIPGGGHGNRLQYSCLEDPAARGTWRATVHGVAKSWTRRKQLSRHTGMNCCLNSACIFANGIFYLKGQNEMDES